MYTYKTVISRVINLSLYHIKVFEISRVFDIRCYTTEIKIGIQS